MEWIFIAAIAQVRTGTSMYVTLNVTISGQKRMKRDKRALIAK